MALTIPLKNLTLEGPDARLGELMLFVAKRCENDPKFGATKLNKIIVFADLVSFLNTGQSITGGKIMRLENGPAPRRLVPVREHLIDQGRATLQTKTFLNGKQQQRLIALDSPKMELFTAQDISFITAVIETFSNHNAQEVSDLSHELPGWKLADDKEDIPLEAAFIASLDASETDKIRGRELSEVHGWSDGV